MHGAQVKVREPPPFFNRGPSAKARLLFFSLVSLAVMVIDYRYAYLSSLREAIATALYPFERIVASPFAAYETMAGFLTKQSTLLAENAELRRALIERSAEAQQAAGIEAEYAHLKTLFGVTEQLNVSGVIAKVLHAGRNPFSRKIVVNRGSNDGLQPGLPVIDGNGVVGQVTAVTVFSAEVTLLTDKDQAVPVMVERNGLRTIVFGTGGADALSISFLPTNADIQKNDRLVTSGIDGTYPAGLAVARVSEIDRGATLAFSRVTAVPIAGVENYRYLMVLTAKPPAKKQETYEKESSRPRAGAARARQ
jgi:rod shape-determining protein MreC